jgi:hypothetical protein
MGPATVLEPESRAITILFTELTEIPVKFVTLQNYNK